MAADPYPNLGFNPCPGNLDGYQALADYTARSAVTIADAVTTLAAAGSGQWTGQAAVAFRTHTDNEVLTLARKASDSVGRSATALRAWVITLSGLQAEARALDRQAAPYREQIAAVLRAAGLPPTATPPYPSSLAAVQKTQLDDANAALTAIITKANALHDEYTTARQKTGSQLQLAENMAPRPPGLFASWLHGIEATFDTAVQGIDDFVHDKALLEFISGVANIVATVAGVLALIPPLSAVFAPVALLAAGTALLADTALAGFDHGSWEAVGWDAAAVIAGGAWIKAAGKLAPYFTKAGLNGLMKEAPTWTGLAAKVPMVGERMVRDGEKSVKVAPGLFWAIGKSLKEADGGSRAVLDQLNAIKDDQYFVWRTVDASAGLASWTTSAVAINAIPGTVRDWVDKIATGHAPWEERAAHATGL